MAEADYLAVLEITPDWTAPLHNLGLIYLNRDEYDKALSLFNHLLEVDPASDFGHSGRANTYYEMKRYSEALADTRFVLASDPNAVIDQHREGRILDRLEDFDAALEAYSRTVLLDTNYALVRLDRAWLYYQHLELPYHAEVDLNHVLALYPNDHVAWAVLGDVLLRLGRYAESETAIERALGIKPEYDFALRTAERFVRETAEAIARSERLSTPAAREIAGPSFGTLLARSFADLGEPERALAEFDTVLAKLPDNAFAHAGKADVYYDLGNDEAAISSLNDFFEVASKREEGNEISDEVIDRQYTRLGFSHHRLGDPQAALAAWRRGLESASSVDISLWQLRLQSAGHYAGGPDGEISDALLDGLSKCASDPECLG
ncbi:tetratricopeptide repeat protein [Ruegeria sp. SCPT10]|uniref:tetratricopeptide repeat protein n=1 Tax=Ruegeria sp. SCP10 TaxID=3141377 RepID=UPI00333745C9